MSDYINTPPIHILLIEAREFWAIFVPKKTFLMKQNLVAPESVKTVVKPRSINLATGGNLVTSLVLENVEMFGKICRKYFE